MKVEGIYQGFVFLGLSFMAVATLLCLCLSGDCDPEWLLFDILLSLFAEVSIFIGMFIFVDSGINGLKKVEKSKVVAELCRNLRVCTVYAMGYSVIQSFFPDMDFYASLVYGVNIFLVAFFFFIFIAEKNKSIEKMWIMENYYY